MQGPDPAHRSVDVNLMMRQDRRVAVDAGRGIHGETFLIARQLAQLRRYLHPGARTCPAWLRWPDWPYKDAQQRKTIRAREGGRPLVSRSAESSSHAMTICRCRGTTQSPPQQQSVARAGDSCGAGFAVTAMFRDVS